MSRIIDLTDTATAAGLPVSRTAVVDPAAVYARASRTRAEREALIARSALLRGVVIGMLAGMTLLAAVQMTMLWALFG